MPEDRSDGGGNNDFAGEAEAVVQARAIHGGVHFHREDRPQPPAPVPRQLPPEVGGFIDRHLELTQLDALLGVGGNAGDAAPAAAIVVIAGAPGVGKTALALKWGHRLRRAFSGGDLYLDMRGYGSEKPLSSEQALDSFLRALNVAPDVIPSELDERVALYRSILAERRVLLVLDNVSSARQVRHIHPGWRHSVTLVTTRGSLSSLVAREGAKRVSLDPVPG